MDFPGAALPGPLFFIFPPLEIIHAVKPLSRSWHFIGISWVYGNTYFPIRTDPVVQPLGLNRKVLPSHGLGD